MTYGVGEIILGGVGPEGLNGRRGSYQVENSADSPFDWSCFDRRFAIGPLSRAGERMILAKIKNTVRGLTSIALLLGTAVTFVSTWAYATGDSVDRAEMDAIVHIMQYEVGLRKPAELYAWLNHPRPDSTNHQILKTLIERATDRPKSFQPLLSHIREKADLPFQNRLKAAASDSTERTRFESLYSKL